MIAYVREENFLCTRRKFGFNKKIRTKLTFPPQQKKYHNHTTVLYTKYVRNTKNYFPPEPKKLTQHRTVWYSKYIVICTTKTYFPPEQKTDTTAQLEKRFLQPTRSVGRFLQPTRSECICSSVCR